MQRKLYILAFALLLCLIALLTSYPFDRSIFFRRTPSQYQQTVVQSKEKAGRRAYATMICKPEMVGSTIFFCCCHCAGA
ncbi:uncharacterized protein BYT42DRAFT_558174 [Radiomyces spectabilis]|uniref:uncharacterized protein n=1 Tax=Radiomyces spectabilis TaxID=64574 RepID=UPI00222064ED|nr:uncharacterized protein BYT42DRAFT_558174 [Radiomyces spectabilis]KAI8391813.1 hypothetical protein BYT42DRAFT_558174 [Radiomyces spectabilis]